MRKIFLLLLMLIPVLYLSGCAQKVKIKALEPAEIDRAANTKKIAVVDFKNDRIGLASKIETKLSQHKIATKPYFTMISRSNINQVLKEQKLQNSGLVNTDDIVDVGNLMGAQAIISGNVNRPTQSDSSFYETRMRCKNKKCTEFEYYKVRCKKRLIGLSAEIKMVDITRGDIIYADSLSKSASYKHCSDDRRTLPSKDLVAQSFADSIARDFTFKLTPHYRYFEVELLEKADLDYTDRQDLLLESALTYIKHNRLDKAERLLAQLVDSTMEQSYVAFYNLGVIKEAQGDYAKAKTYYEKADNLTIEPVETIDKAYNRIKSIMQKDAKTKQQINR